MTAGPLRLEPLSARHDVHAFDCGTPALNEFLAARALSDQRSGKSRTYVALRARQVVAYFSLAAASVEPETATTRAVAGQGAQPVPCILLGRLAVDVADQHSGLGEQMLVEALRACVRAADVIGVRAVLVHAKSAAARDFYLRYGFEPSPTHVLHLMMLMKDVRRSLVN